MMRLCHQSLITGRAMRPSMRVIEIFVRVAERGSFIAAARSLLIDPAAVSRAISGLEETIRGFQADARVTRQLRIGLGPALSRRMLLRAIPGFLEQHPEIQLLL